MTKPKGSRSPVEAPGGKGVGKCRPGPKSPGAGKLMAAKGRAEGHARSRGREVEALPARRYEGDARHWEIERHDYEWHEGQRRRFYTAAGAELASMEAVEIALVHGEEVWSR